MNTVKILWIATIFSLSTHNWTSHITPTETCMTTSSRMMSPLMLSFSILFIALMAPDSLCKRDFFINRKTTEDELEKHIFEFTIYDNKKKKVFAPGMDLLSSTGQRLQKTFCCPRQHQRRVRQASAFLFPLSFLWNSLEMLLWCHFSTCDETISSVESRSM